MDSPLVIFDFDCTIIDVDSDPWVAERLGMLPIFDELRSRMPWNDMMEVFLTEAQQQKDGEVAMAAIVEALRCAPLQPPKISAIRSAHNLGCELRIVSDANDFFIKTILDKHDVTHLFTEIHTNPTYFDEQGRIHIKPFHPKTEAPHCCPNCPPNMCKGRIMEDIFAKAIKKSQRVIYVGDGCGDFCPSLKLRLGDCILPRKGYPLMGLLTENIQLINATVHPWSSAEDMEETLIGLITNESSLDKDTTYVGVYGAHCLQSALEPSNEMLSVTRVKA